MSATRHAVTLDEAKARLPDLIEAAIGGSEVVIIRSDRSMVRLVPVTGAKSRPQFGSARGLVTMAEDFDAPLEDFAGYMP